VQSGLPKIESLTGESEHQGNIALTMNCIGHRVAAVGLDRAGEGLGE
jgi:hypothetical protein